MTGPLQLGEDALDRLPAGALVTGVHDAFLALATGRLANPPRQETIGRPGDPDYFRLDMPAELRDAAGQLLVSGTKIIEERGTRDEHGQRALGARDARFEYQDHQTGLGALLAVDRLTNLRTGAAAAWSARYVVGTAEVVAVIGAGRVAQATIEAVDRLLRPAEIRFTSRSAERREGVCQALAPRLTARLTAVGDVATATAGAPVVIAAIPAEAPVLTAATTSAARVVVAVEGDPRPWLVAPELLRSGQVVVDHVAQARESGSLRRTPVIPAATVPELAAGRWAPRAATQVIVVLTGLAAVDLWLARLVVAATTQSDTTG